MVIFSSEAASYCVQDKLLQLVLSGLVSKRLVQEVRLDAAQRASGLFPHTPSTVLLVVIKM